MYDTTTDFVLRQYESELSRFSRTVLTLAATATLLIMTIGISGNLLTIVALIKCQKRNVASYFIISLCAADCLFCVLVLPFMAVRYIHGAWIYGEGFFCTLVPFMQYGNVGCSLLCIALITINRYVMIVHHSLYAKIYKRSWILAMIAFAWIFSYGFQFPTLLGFWGQFGYDPKLETCSILTDDQGRSSKTALFIIAFLIPCVIIIVCYTRIFWVLHKSQEKLRKHAEAQQHQRRTSESRMPSNNNLINAEQNVPKDVKIAKDEKAEHKQRRNEWRITKMVLAIFLSFLVCYLPITVIKVVDKNVHWPGLHIFGYIMLYLSSCVNPIIYVIMNKQYRKAYKNVLCCKPSRLLSKGLNSHDG